MKCDELKSLWVYCRDINEDEDEDFIEFAKKNGYEELVAKSDVDEAVEELKAEHHKERDEYISMVYSREQTIKELKQKLENVQASMYADVVDANMENRRLKRALWLSRAYRAHKEVILFRDFSCLVGKEFKWRKIEKLCMAKAEEYK